MWEPLPTKGAKQMKVMQSHPGTAERTGFYCSRALLVSSPSLQIWGHRIITPHPSLLPFLCLSSSNPCTPGSGRQHPVPEFQFCFSSSLLTSVFPLEGKKNKFLCETSRKCLALTESLALSGFFLFLKRLVTLLWLFRKLEASAYHYSQQEKKKFFSILGRF